MEKEEGFFESVHKNFLIATYIPSVRGGQTIGHFKFKKEDFFDLAVLTYGFHTNKRNDEMAIAAQ